MSSRRKRLLNRKIRDSHPSLTMKECYERGLLPYNLHLYDFVEMKELHLREKTDWWKRMSEPI